MYIWIVIFFSQPHKVGHTDAAVVVMVVNVQSCTLIDRFYTAQFSVLDDC